MREHSRVLKEIEKLEGLVCPKRDWFQIHGLNFRAAWEQVKVTQTAFNETRFPTVGERQDAWRKFQELVHNIRERQTEESECVRDEIVRLVNLADPKEWWVEALLTLGLSELLRIALDSLPGPNSVKSDLQDCTRKLQEARKFYRDNKSALLKQHKTVALDAIRECEDKLNRAWSEYKKGKSQAHEVRQEERRNRIQANIEKNQNRLNTLQNALSRKDENLDKNRQRVERLEGSIEHMHEHLDQLHERLSGARTDSYRESVNDWIEEQTVKISEATEKLDKVRTWMKDDESAIGDIRDKIERVRGWIKEDKRSLG